MKGMGLIKLSQETDGIKLKSVLSIEYDWIRMNIIEHSWKLYLKLKIRGITITNKFIITSLTFYTTNNLGHMKRKQFQDASILLPPH